MLLFSGSFTSCMGIKFFIWKIKFVGMWAIVPCGVSFMFLFVSLVKNVLVLEKHHRSQQTYKSEYVQ